MLCEALVDSSVEVVEGAAERTGGGSVAGQDGGEAWTQEAVVGSCKEESGAPSAIGDAISMAVGQALDHAVQSHAAKLVGDGAAADVLGYRLLVDQSSPCLYQLLHCALGARTKPKNLEEEP